MYLFFSSPLTLGTNHPGLPPDYGVCILFCNRQVPKTVRALIATAEDSWSTRDALVCATLYVHCFRPPRHRTDPMSVNAAFPLLTWCLHFFCNRYATQAACALPTSVDDPWISVGAFACAALYIYRTLLTTVDDPRSTEGVLVCAALCFHAVRLAREPTP